MPDVTHDGKRWSNADQGRVELVAYDPSWPSRYETEARAIRAAHAGLTPFDLVHFGSTAIPGRAANPIIAIMLVSGDPSAWPALIEPLERLGYVFWADNPRRDRLFFVKGMPPFGTQRTHHVHVRAPADASTALVFCEYLRRHPGEAARYAALKRELTARHATDRDTYTEGKARYADDIVRKAGTP
jgi:GrpB-like predicted nucleotidyltransferase (UPF0157 family)